MISGTRYSIATEVGRQQKLSAQIAETQNDISSGVRIHAASDDPLASRRLAQIRATQASQATWKSNIAVADQIASQVEDNLDAVQTQLTRARELVLKAQTGTASATDRAAIATELRGLIGEVDTLSQATDFTGTPLYATDNPVAIPVGPDLSLAAAAGRTQVFGSVTLPDNSTTSIASLLGAAATAIETGDTAAMTTAAANVGAAQTHVATMLTDAGVRSQRIDTANDRLESATIDLEDERSKLEDTDITAASADLVQKRVQLEAAQSILAQLARNTLFDKLA